MKKPKIIAGNWKMYKTIEETKNFITQLPSRIQSNASILLAVPFTSLYVAANTAKNTPIVIGAQNMWMGDEGPFTGEISGKMLIDAGARFVLLGHSERRLNFHETNSLVNWKLKQALSLGLTAMLLIGETLKERKEGLTHSILEEQIKKCLHGIEAKQFKNILIAYEPIWAIGTGESATPQMAEEVHLFIRSVVKSNWGEEVAENLSILYGGSVKPDNAKSLLSMPNIDGVLVGGASLSLESFSQMVNDSTLI